MARIARPLRVLALLGGMAVLCALLGFVEHDAARSPITAVEVEVTGAPGIELIDRATVHGIVLQDFTVIGTAVRELDIAAIEDRLMAEGCVAQADAYHTMDGVLRVVVAQREPIARVINPDGSSFYIAADGHTMPLSPRSSARVLVFTGAAHAPYARQVVRVDTLRGSEGEQAPLAIMHHIAKTLYADPLWRPLFEQVDLDRSVGFELIPRVGAQRVRIGMGEELDIRLEKLRHFYSQGIAQTDWRRYSIIDLRFAEQVVCTKRQAS